MDKNERAHTEVMHENEPRLYLLSRYGYLLNTIPDWTK